MSSSWTKSSRSDPCVVVSVIREAYHACNVSRENGNAVPKPMREKSEVGPEQDAPVFPGKIFREANAGGGVYRGIAVVDLDDVFVL
jgi:hypothetical protein